MLPEAAVPSLDVGDIDPLVVGVSLLGSGGGGDAATFARLLRRRLRDGSLALHRPHDLPDAVVVPVGVVGATSVFTEKLPGGEEFTAAVAAVTRWARRPATAVMALEAGGLNGITALVAAIDLNLPFVDADLMGRALPRLDQLTWAAIGRPVTPCALREPSGQILVVDGTDTVGLERTARAFLTEAGGWAALALPPARLADIADDGIRGSIEHAIALGRAHAALPDNPSPAAVAAALGGQVLGTGRVLEVARHGPAGNFGRGSVCVANLASGSVLRLEAENEFLLALVDGLPAASTPDLLCVLDRRTAVPLRVDEVRAGHEVTVVTLPGPAWWRRPEVVAHVAPAAFGLDCPPVLSGSPA